MDQLLASINRGPSLTEQIKQKARKHQQELDNAVASFRMPLVYAMCPIYWRANENGDQCPGICYFVGTRTINCMVFDRPDEDVPPTLKVGVRHRDDPALIKQSSAGDRANGVFEISPIGELTIYLYRNIDKLAALIGTAPSNGDAAYDPANEEQPEEPRGPHMATDAQIKEINEYRTKYRKEKKLKAEEFGEVVNKYGAGKTDELTFAQADEVLAWLESLE